MKAGWKQVRLEEVFDLDLNTVAVDPAETYDMVGVLSYGRGLFQKPPVAGADTSYKTFYRLAEGQIVLSQLFGWEGAIAPVSPNHYGKYVSSQFPTFRPRGNLNFSFSKWLVRFPIIWEQLKSSAKGMGDRRRTLSPEIFNNVTALLPPLSEQRRIADHLDAIEERLNRIQKLREDQAKELNAALRSAFHKIEADSDWVEMGEVAPLVRRPVEIDPTKEYPELGARSFGKGIFHKPNLIGSELTWQKLFQVHDGDIVISNIKAWEGAIAVATKADHGRVGSHRYLTCVVDPKRAIPDFICFYLLTRAGLEKVGRASPGSADRNRTLAVKRMEKITVPVPAMERQQEFLKLLQLRSAIQRKSENVGMQRDAILPSLLDRTFTP